MKNHRSRARGKRLEAILDALDDMAPAEHEDYLARHCSDPQLRHDALTLWAAQSASTGYLEKYTQNLVPKSRKPVDLTGQRIGAWRLLKPLGHGGMGVVYEAERADGAFEQRVALKLLSTALADGEAHRRFLAERRILAGLEHPSIAHILDGGVTEDGTPWFAMERVEGLPIDKYCDRHELDVRQRLELFLQVCDAVEHAHRRLVVHRDLKPGNVLVASKSQSISRRNSINPDGDSDYKVKLLDFGIAKLLDADGSDAPATRTSLRMMTPEYACPEQVRGEPITTASDVYQLGLLLYELLTGHCPYGLHHRSAGEMGRVICEQSTTRLSAAVACEDTVKVTGDGPPVSVTELCRLRGSSPAKLRRRLRGDLENIVLKALSKEPERRYGSADRLAQDIRRHLTGLPVVARADTWRYRSRKFLQRHAIGAAATALVLVIISTMTGLYIVRIQSAYDLAEVERIQAQVERDRAETEASKAQQMNNFLTSLFRSVDPREAQGVELSARELLDRGLERVDHELTTQPEIQAEMLHVLGRTYLELGVFNSAEALLARALELRRGQDEPEHRGIVRTMIDVSLLRHHQGKYEQARQILEEATGILGTSLGSDAQELANVLRLFGAVYSRLGDNRMALTTLERALAIQAQVSGEHSEPVASILFGMGVPLFEMGELERSAILHERALEIYEEELGREHPQVGTVLMNLALIRMEQGETKGIEDMFRRSLAIRQNAYGPHHIRTSTALSNLGQFLIKAGAYNEAIELLEEAVTIYETAGMPNHFQVVFPLVSLGGAHMANGRLHEARDYYRRSVTIREHSQEARSFDWILVFSHAKLGTVEAELGNFSEAEQSFRRALAILQQAPETTDPRLAPALLDICRWLTGQQRCNEALSLPGCCINPLDIETTRPIAMHSTYETICSESFDWH